VTDKHESVHFCVPDVLAVLFAVYMKGKGSSVCGVIGHGTLLFTFPLGWQWQTEWKIIVDSWTGPEFAATGSGYTKEVEDMLKVLSPWMVSFIKNLPAIKVLIPHFRHIIGMVEYISCIII